VGKQEGRLLLKAKSARLEKIFGLAIIRVLGGGGRKIHGESAVGKGQKKDRRGLRGVVKKRCVVNGCLKGDPTMSAIYEDVVASRKRGNLNPWSIQEKKKETQTKVIDAKTTSKRIPTILAEIVGARQKAKEGLN